MALTKEQKEFKAEVDDCIVRCHETVEEAKALCTKMIRQAREFERLERIIRAMAKEHGIT